MDEARRRTRPVSNASRYLIERPETVAVNTPHCERPALMRAPADRGKALTWQAMQSMIECAPGPGGRRARESVRQHSVRNPSGATRNRPEVMT